MEERTAINPIGISVVVPVYNTSPFLHQRIDSILNQTFTDFELICVDDGSTDDSLKILQEYAAKDNRITVLEIPHENAGAARNVGMDVARGEYITFLDADDFCEPTMLEVMYEACKEKDLDVVVCRTGYYSEATGETTFESGAIKDDMVPKSLNGVFSWRDCQDTVFQIFVPWTWDKLYRRAILVDHKIQGQSLPAANSFTLASEVMIWAERIYVLDEVLCYQRRDLQSSITHRLDQAWNCGYLASKKLMEDLKAWGRFEEFMVSYQNIALHNIVWYLQKLEDHPKLYVRLYNLCKEQYLEDLELIDLNDTIIVNRAELAVYEDIRDNDVVTSLLHRNQELHRQLAGTEGRVRAQIAGGISYRIGRIVTAPARKVRRVLVAHKNSIAYKGCRKLWHGLRTVPAIWKHTIWKLKNLWRDIIHGSANRSVRKAAKKRIAILAYESFHAFILNSIVQISNYKKNYVEVYTSNAMKEELRDYLGDDMSLIHWRSIPQFKKLNRAKNGALWASVSKSVSHKRYLDMVILPSPEYNFRNYEPVLCHHPKGCEVVAMIHNVNRIFRGGDADTDLGPTIMKADSFAVLDKLLVDEIVNNKLTEKKVYEFPIVFREEQAQLNPYENDRFVFVVTGHVEKGRKDFDLLMQVFEDLQEYYEQMELILLGSATTPYGRIISKQCRRLRTNGLQVQFYNRFVPTTLFRQTIKRCDYLLGVVNVNYDDKGLVETYNKTKMTGIVTDMIEYARPAIVPHDLAMPEALASSTLYYQDGEDLKAQIIGLLDRERCRALNSEAQKNARKYIIDKYLL